MLLDGLLGGASREEPNVRSQRWPWSMKPEMGVEQLTFGAWTLDNLVATGGEVY